jgi:hypothetical protein
VAEVKFGRMAPLLFTSWVKNLMRVTYDYTQDPYMVELGQTHSSGADLHGDISGLDCTKASSHHPISVAVRKYDCSGSTDFRVTMLLTRSEGQGFNPQGYGLKFRSL